MSIDPFDTSREGFEKRQNTVEEAQRKQGYRIREVKGFGKTYERFVGGQWVNIDEFMYNRLKAGQENVTYVPKLDIDFDGLRKKYQEQSAEPEELNKKPDPDYILGKQRGAFSNFALGKFTPLRYPKERTQNNQDYIEFSVIKYQRRDLTGGPVGSRTLNQNRDTGLIKNLLGNITLPIPSQVSDMNSVNYASGQMNFLARDILPIADNLIGGDPSGAFNALHNLGESLVNNKEAVTKYFAQQAIQSLGLNITLDQLLVRSNGAIINPNMELLFTSPNLRTFTFAFKFTPRFEEEGEEVRQIIRTFKKYSSPKGAGDYLKAPDIFQIRYLGRAGQPHSFLNRFKLCALTNMTVNYTGDGVYATYENETPISMIMTLNFKELTPVYAEDYNNLAGGVGY